MAGFDRKSTPPNALLPWVFASFTRDERRSEATFCTAVSASENSGHNFAEHRTYRVHKKFLRTRCFHLRWKPARLVLVRRETNGFSGSDLGPCLPPTPALSRA